MASDQQREFFAHTVGLNGASIRFIDGEPMKAATKRLSGCIEELLWRGNLLEDAALDHRDPVAHGHGLDLVVGDVEGGDAQLALQRGDLGPHLHPQLGIEVRQRLVEQEERGSRTMARPMATRWR